MHILAYADIPPGEGASIDCRGRKRQFSGLLDADFGTIGNEANIQYYLAPCCLSTDPKYITLNDFEWLEWPFYVKFSLLRTALSAVRLHCTGLMSRTQQCQSTE